MLSLKSLQNPLVKHLTKLRESKSYRYETKKALIYGKTVIQELSKAIPIRTLVASQELSIPADKIYQVPPEILKKIMGLDHPEMAVAEVDLPPFQDLSQKQKIIILDGVQDPGNLGTILRSALGLGFEGAYLIHGCADPFGEKAIRAAKGASFHLALGEGSLEDLGFKGDFFGADARGEKLEKVVFTPPFALVFGNEGHGLSEEITKISKIVAISLTPEVESLNVASAAAIMLYWASLKT